MKRQYSMMGLILFTFFISSCKNDDDIVTPKPTRVISGVAILKNGNDNALNSNGINVAIEGTSISSYTDSSGKYIIVNVEYGEQCFVYSKSGYGIYKQYSIVSDSSNPNLNGLLLFRLPTNKVTNLSAHFTNDTLKVTGIVSSNIRYTRGIVLFISKDSSVSSDPLKHLFSINDFNTHQDSTNFTIPITKDQLLSKGINSGTIIYIVAYTSVDHGFNFREYLDKKSGKISYNGIGLSPSNVAAIQIP